MALAGSGEKDHHVAHLARHAEAQQVAVERERTIQVAHLEHDVANAERLEHTSMLLQGRA
jgi:hypothetical protein